MDDNVIDTLRIEIEGDSTNAVQGLEQLISTLERLRSTTQNIQPPNFNPAGVNEALSGFTQVRETVSEATAATEDFNQRAQSVDTSGFVRSQSEVDLLKMKLTDATTKLHELLVSGDTKSAAVANLIQQIKVLERKIYKATGRGKELMKVFSDIGLIGSSVFGGIASRIRNLFTMFGKRVLYRALNGIISAITSSLKEGIDAAYQYSKSIDGRLAKSLDSIATSFQYLKASLGAMAAPIINILAPVIEQLVDKFVNLLNIINQVFARLSGATTWTKATKVAVSYAESVDNVTAANKRLKKSILGIDEINPLHDNSSSSGNNNSNNNSIPGYAFEEVPLDTAYVDGIIKKLKDILWYVGAIGLGIAAWNFGKALAQLMGLSGLSALELAAGLTLVVAGLTIMVKGMVDIIANGINWQNFFETLGGGAAAVLGGTLIGAAFGNAALGAAISAIVVGIPMYIVGIWGAIKEGLNWLNGVLIAAGATLAGAGIGAIIGMLGGPIGAGIGALIGLAVGALTDLVILIVQNWDEVVAWCSQALTDIGQFFVGIWEWICNVWSVVSEWFDTNVIQPLVSFFTSCWEWISSAASACWNAIVEFFSPAVEWFSELFGGIWQTISDIFYNIGVIASGCWEIIKRVWSIVSEWFNTNIIQPVGNFFSNLWNGIKNAAVTAWNAIKSFLAPIVNWFNANIIQPLTNFFSNLWNGFKEKARAAWEGVKQVFSKVAEFFGNIFRNAWAGIVKVFSIAGEIFTDIKDGVVTAFKWVVNGIINGINKVVAVPFNAINGVLRWLRDITIVGIQPFSGIKEINVPQIPNLAEGGMLNAGTMFVAGEAGAEVVAQIGRHTGVMNTDEMRESVAQGVVDANAEQNALLREEISILRKLLDKDWDVTTYVSTGNLIDGLARKNRRDGKTVVPVGT